MKTRYCDLHEKEYPWYQGCYECLFEDYHATSVMVTNLKGELEQWKENWQKEKSAHMLTIADSKTAEGNLRAILEKFASALKKIARGTLEPGHVYEQAVMMQDIAIKVLQEEHGCTVMGAKVCFACGECDPLTSADLGKNCGGVL